MRWNDLKEQVCRWSRKNFGEQGPCRLVCGVAEVLLYEYPLASSAAERADALADASIFMLNLIGVLGLDADEVFESDEEPRLSGDAVVAKLARAALKIEQGIRQDEDHRATALLCLQQLACLIREQAEDAGLDHYLLVNRVWTWVVSGRDWRSDQEKS